MGCGVYSPVCQLRLSESRPDLDPPVRERCQPVGIPRSPCQPQPMKSQYFQRATLSTPSANPDLSLICLWAYLGGSLLNTKRHPVTGHQKFFRITIQTQQRQRPGQVYQNQPVSLNSGSEFRKIRLRYEEPCLFILHKQRIHNNKFPRQRNRRSRLRKLEGTSESVQSEIGGLITA